VDSQAVRAAWANPQVETLKTVFELNRESQLGRRKVKSVSVIGLGKLGAPMAACMAAQGLNVVAVDLNSRKVSDINNGVAPVHEPGLEELIKEAGTRLRATENIPEAVQNSEVTFVVVATPSDASGGFSLQYVLPTCEAVGRAIATKKSFHLVVLTSTVMPGSTGGAVLASLDSRFL
jgi:UDPglucose 6-dehydrogenase